MKSSNLVKALNVCIAARRPAMIWGKPGVGKSAIMAWLVTQRAGWLLLDFRLLIRDAVDVRGVPFVDEKTGRTMWAVPAEFPKEGTKGIWFLDELPAAHPQVQATMYQLVLDRMIGEYKLPDGWIVMAAGNYEDDGAVSHKMPTPLRSRFVHLDLEVDVDDWVAWAQAKGIRPEVVAFIRFRPEQLQDFKKEYRAYPCPRTWEFMSDILNAGTEPSVEHDLFAGTVGAGAGVEFSGFLRMWRALPTIESILASPGTATVPMEPSAMYAVATALGRRSSVANFKAVVTYLERLPVEFNVMAVKDAQARLPELAKLGVFTQWCVKHSDVTFS